MTAQSDILTRIHEMPPVDTTYVAGRWHRDWVALGGLMVEARVFLKSLMIPATQNKRFLIIGRARSGTTLLTKLLNGHSQIKCDGEVLHRHVFGPTAHLRRLAQKNATPVYGAKLLSYQMVQVHRMRDPVSFLKALSDEGVFLIHLERDTFFQTLSLSVAQRTRHYHSHKDLKTPKGKLTLEPQDFLKRLLWNAELLAYERAALENLPHIHLVYERDLSKPETQVETLARLCAALDVPPETIEIELKKVLPTEPAQIIDNTSDVFAAIKEAGYEKLLPENVTGTC